jgi:site-specific recombinase XerD
MAYPFLYIFSCFFCTTKSSGALGELMSDTVTSVLEQVASSKSEIHVIVFSRHSDGCTHDDDRLYLTCKCPKWLEWFDGSQHRISAKTRDRDEARAKAREMMNSFARIAKGETAPAKDKKSYSMLDAIDLYVENQKGKIADGPRRKGKMTWLRWEYKIRRELERFGVYCTAKGKMGVADFTKADALVYANGLKGENITKKQHLNRLRAFFHFCEESLECIEKNPFKQKALELSTDDPQKPKSLSEEQCETWYAAAIKYNHATYYLLKLMRWTGLSLRDALLRKRSDLKKMANGYYKIETARAKTGKPVYCVLRPEIAEEVLKAPATGTPYLFLSEAPPTDNKGLTRLAQTWGQRLRDLGKKANIKNEDGEVMDVGSHWMRHTFVHHCLLHGLPTEDVAALIGDTVQVVAARYSEWIPKRQEKLEERMLAMFGVTK